MTIHEFIDSNKASGGHFFDKATLKFFNSKIYNETWVGDGYFITSEHEGESREKFSIRKGSLEDFGVETVAGFQRFDAKKDALTALREIRKGLNA